MFLQTVDRMLITEFSNDPSEGSLIDFVANYPVLGNGGYFMIWWLIYSLEIGEGKDNKTTYLDRRHITTGQ